MDIRREPVFESEQRKSAPTLAEFAKKSQITEDKVWELIEEGEVSARFVNEAILILQDLPPVSVSSQELPVKEPVFAMEPNIPEVEVAAPKSPSPPPERERKIPSKPLTPPEKSYSFKPEASFKESLQDYDFAEDSTEFLTFAQDALSRTSELSKELLATKNELIRLKDERIAFLSELVQKKDIEIRQLNRNIEELVTLTNFEAR